MRKTLLKICLGLSVLFAFLSCQNQLDINEDNNKAYIQVAIGEEEASARTIKPTNEKYTEDFGNIVLKGTKDGETEVTIGSWSTYSDLQNNKWTEIDAGTWSFTLTADRYGSSFSQTINRIVESGKKASLSFLNLAKVSGTTGAFEVRIQVPVECVYIHADTYFAENDSRNTSYDLTEKAESKEITNWNSEDGNIFWGKTYNYKEMSLVVSEIDEGNWSITVNAYDADWKSVYTFPSILQIKAGYKSYGKLGSYKLDTISRNEHTITYKDSSSTYTQNYGPESVIASAEDCGFTNAGYRIRYWTTSLTDSDAATYTAGSQPTITSDITLYAVWIEDTYRGITYYSNNGDGNEDHISVKENTEVTLKTVVDCGFVKNATNDFCGWDTKKDGTGTRYDAADKVTLTDDMSLYAQWCDTLNKQDGTGFGYIISDNADWNAVFNRKGCETEISGIILLDSDLEDSGLTLTSSNLALTKNKTFTGTFNGQDMYLTTTDTLFNEISSDATVKNVNFAGMKSGAFAGVVTNINNGTISDCVVSGKIYSDGMTGLDSNTSRIFGGICGINNGTVKNCSVTSEITSNQGDLVGGIAGLNEGTISSCKKVSGSIYSYEDSSNIGGIAGKNTGTISYCNSGVTISSNGKESNIGGIAGLNTYNSSNTDPLIQLCMSWCDLTLNYTGNVGGIAGKSVMYTTKAEKMKWCAATGTLNGGTYQGGLIGYNYKTRAYYSYTALKDASDGDKFGGLYGYEYDGNGSTGWEECYASTEKGATVKYCSWKNGTDGRNGSVFSYLTSKVSNPSSTYFKANSSSSYGGLPYIVIQQ